jgi:hypothetical protein
MDMKQADWRNPKLTPLLGCAINSLHVRAQIRTIPTVRRQAIHTLFNNTRAYTIIVSKVRNSRLLTFVAEPPQRSRYSYYATGWSIRGSKPGRGQESFLFSKMPRPVGPAQPPLQWVPALFPWGKAAVVCSCPLATI